MTIISTDRDPMDYVSATVLCDLLDFRVVKEIDSPPRARVSQPSSELVDVTGYNQMGVKKPP